MDTPRVTAKVSVNLGKQNLEIRGCISVALCLAKNITAFPLYTLYIYTHTFSKLKKKKNTESG